jgi:glycosyltransferase involved in cell wall biosynthesis
MGKNKKQKEPFVSVCTPTFNRRPFIENMFRCFRNQNYPKDRIEWIIVDDGTDKIKDLIDKSGIEQIKYFPIEEKMTLGTKRNFMHKQIKGSIVVYMDDDDYYPPERISHAVERLQGDKNALCAGSSEIYIYFKGLNRMVQCGPYNPNHATAGTFAFKAELLKQTQYEDHAAIAEERAFLKGYTIPFVQLDPLKTILVFSHEHNTFDKRKMLDNPHPDYLKDSDKTVDTFIRMVDEAPIKDFFMNKIDKLLENYEPGEPKMKPDVLAQIKVIEAERAEMLRKANEEMAAKNANGPIVLQRPGEAPKELSQQEVVQIMQQQLSHIGALTNKIQELEKIVVELQMQIIQNSTKVNEPIFEEKSTETTTIVSEEIDLNQQIIKSTPVDLDSSKSINNQRGPLILVEGD